MLTWDSMVRDYAILITALSSKGVDISKYRPITKSLADVTLKVDGKYIQKSPDKVKRDLDFDKLRRMNLDLIMKLEAAKASGRPTIDLGALPPGLKLPKDKSSKSPVSVTSRPLFKFPSIGPLGKMAILGAGTLAILWFAARSRKHQPSMDERRREVIKERVVKRIPLVRKQQEVEATQPHEEYVVEEVVEEKTAPDPAPAPQTVVPEEF